MALPPTLVPSGQVLKAQEAAVRSGEQGADVVGVDGGAERVPVPDGVPDHRDSVLDAGQRAAGDCMMICVSRSYTSRLVLDL